jgi:hypothetical protein
MLNALKRRALYSNRAPVCSVVQLWAAFSEVVSVWLQAMGG